MRSLPTLPLLGLILICCNSASPKAEPPIFELFDALVSGPMKQAKRVAKLQRLLAEAGYYSGRVDGEMGEQTIAAIKSFQEDHKLPITGQLTKGELNLLKQVASKDGSPQPTDQEVADNSAADDTMRSDPGAENLSAPDRTYYERRDRQRSERLQQDREQAQREIDSHLAQRQEHELAQRRAEDERRAACNPVEADGKRKVEELKARLRALGENDTAIQRAEAGDNQISHPFSHLICEDYREAIERLSRLEQQHIEAKRSQEEQRAKLAALVKEASEKGPSFARQSRTAWTVEKKTNEMTDNVDIIVQSIQSNSTGVSAEVVGHCATKGTVVFTALLVDSTGSPTLHFPDAHPDIQATKALVRINDAKAFGGFLTHLDFNNKFVLARLSVGTPPSAKPASGIEAYLSFVSAAANLGLQLEHGARLFDDVLPREAVWRILAEIKTSSGSLLISIPTFDANIQQLFASCSSEENGAVPVPTHSRSDAGLNNSKSEAIETLTAPSRYQTHILYALGGGSAFLLIALGLRFAFGRRSDLSSGPSAERTVPPPLPIHQSTRVEIKSLSDLLPPDLSARESWQSLIWTSARNMFTLKGASERKEYWVQQALIAAVLLPLYYGFSFAIDHLESNEVLLADTYSALYSILSVQTALIFLALSTVVTTRRLRARGHDKIIMGAVYAFAVSPNVISAAFPLGSYAYMTTNPKIYATYSLVAGCLWLWLFVEAGFLKSTLPTSGASPVGSVPPPLPSGGV